jgi:hypothetical protein
VGDSPTSPTGDMAQPSIESARETAFKTLAQLAIGGGLTLDEYAERAAVIQQAATTTEIDALRRPGRPAARPPVYLAGFR